MRSKRGARIAVAGAILAAVSLTSAAHAQTGVRTFQADPLLPELSAVAAQPVTPQGVSEAIGSTLEGGALGTEVSAVVVAADDAILFDRAGQVPRVPASATKILTAVGVLTALGPDHRLTTEVVKNENSLVVVGAGDPSLRSSRDDPGIGPTLENLAQRTARELQAGGAVGPFDLVADISAFTGPQLATGWSRADVTECYVRPVVALMASVPPAGACQPGVEPQIAALNDFAEYLQQAGIEVTGNLTTGTAEAQAVPIASVTSPPMSALVEAIMLDSDNTGAEMLAHLAGLAASGEGSFAGGAEATLQAMSGLGIDIEGVRLDDASGMSELNQVTMSSVVGALQAASAPDHRPTLWPVIAGLPAAGFDGTLASRFGSGDTIAGRGEVRAKTGTLTGISALAGQVITEQGELLTFAFVSNSTSNTTAARAQLDEAAAQLAECGCR